MYKKLLIILLLLCSMATTVNRPRGSGIAYIGDSIRMGTFTYGGLGDTLIRWWIPGRTAFNDNTIVDVHDSLQRIFNDLGRWSVDFKYIVCNTGMHEVVRHGAIDAPFSVSLDTFVLYWQYVIDSLEAHYPKAELIWLNTTPVSDSVRCEGGYATFACNADIDIFNDSGRAVFRRNGYYKEMSYDSVITANNFEPLPDGVHWIEAGAYPHFASYFKQSIFSFGNKYVSGWNLTNCEYLINPTIMKDTLLNRNFVPTWSYDSSITTYDSSVIIDSGAGLWRLNCTAGGHIRPDMPYKIGGRNGSTIEIAFAITGTTYKGLVTGYVDAQNYIRFTTLSNVMYSKVISSGIPTINNNIAITTGYHVFHLTASKLGVYNLYIDGVKKVGPVALLGDTITLPYLEYGSPFFETARSPGGYLYHVAQYSHELTPTEITQNVSLLPMLTSGDSIILQNNYSILSLTSILITTQPENDTVIVGQPISFFVTVAGDNINYAMYRFGADTSIYYDSAVTFTATSAHHGDSIQFVAWNSSNTVYSSKAYIGTYTMRTDSVGIYTGPYFKGQYDLEPDSVAIDGINMSSFTYTDSTVYGPAPAPMMWRRGEETGGKYLCRMYTIFGNHLVYVDLRKSGSVTVMKPTSINTSIGF